MIEKPKKTRGPYLYHSDAVWALIRERYLEGQSARALAEAFAATEWAIRARANREGWTKRALAKARAPDILEALGRPTGLAADALLARHDEPMEPREAVRAAVETAVRWMREGKMGQAAEAARLADVLGRAVGRLEAGDGPTEDEAVDAVAFEAVRRKVLRMGDGQAPSTASQVAPQEEEEVMAEEVAPLPPSAVPLPICDAEDKA